MSGTVTARREGPLAFVTLSHPGRLNAMSRSMWRELAAVFATLHADRELRCIVVAGEGGAFCAGGDIAEYPAFRFEPASLRAFHEDDVWGGLAAMLACDVPIIAAIEGACMGAGVEIACCCDFRVAAADAKFGAPIAKLGFPMAPRELALVREVAGANTLREMLLAAAVLDAPTMRERGFLQEVVAPDAVAAAVRALAGRIAALAPGAARRNKQGLRALAGHNPRPEETTGDAYGYAADAEHREGIAAFLARRPPRF